jgi:acetyl esterase/lipase
MFRKMKIGLFSVLALGLSYVSPVFASNQGPVICSTPTCGAQQQPNYAVMPTWKDLIYASLSPSEKLDIYTPMTVGPFPTIVYVHGGGFRQGDKSQPYDRGIVAALVADGYAVASVNYRLSGEAPFPAAPQDVKAAIRWLRANAALYHLDPNKFGIWGDSAGGNLASLMATSCGDSYLEGNLGNAGESSCVQALVDFYGNMSFLLMDQDFANSGITCPTNPETHHLPTSAESEYISDDGDSVFNHKALARLADPITYISGDEPPTFIQHGTADCTVPQEQSQRFYDNLVTKIDPTTVSIGFLSGAIHGDPAFYTSSNLALVVAFLDQYLK